MGVLLLCLYFSIYNTPSVIVILQVLLLSFIFKGYTISKNNKLFDVFLSVLIFVLFYFSTGFLFNGLTDYLILDYSIFIWLIILSFIIMKSDNRKINLIFGSILLYVFTLFFRIQFYSNNILVITYVEIVSFSISLIMIYIIDILFTHSYFVDKKDSLILLNLLKKYTIVCAVFSICILVFMAVYSSLYNEALLGILAVLLYALFQIISLLIIHLKLSLTKWGYTKK